ncbi:tRNA (guanine(10)-N(2))-dimethyltransferase [Nanoarchaeota archaeon]
MKTIIEQSTKIKATLPIKDPTKKQIVFYNPLMKSNRDISITLLNSISNKNIKIALPLAGSGIRGIRFLSELNKSKIKEIHFNDIKENFKKVLANNLKLNKIKSSGKIKISNQEASTFLLNQECFYYIDIDPFGSPNPFLAASVARISRNGILAITATDTAALTGTYLKSTKRKYWSTSLKNYLMHEIGLRILIRKVQLQGIQFDKALIPILSYHKDHYFRVYFRSDKGKQKADEIVRQHQYFLFCNKCLNFKTSHYNKETCNCRKHGKQFNFAGPLWVGKLFDKKLVQKMSKNNQFPEEQKFLDLLKEESKQDSVGFHDLHQIAKTYKIQPPQMKDFLKKTKSVRTHFSMNGFKTDKGINELIKSLKK